MQVRAGLGVDDEARAAGVDVLLGHRVGRVHHEVGLERQRRVVRAEAITSGPNVRLGTNWPSITSHWMRSTPAASSAATSSPRREKSAGSTDGTIWIGLLIAAATYRSAVTSHRADPACRVLPWLVVVPRLVGVVPRVVASFHGAPPVLGFGTAGIRAEHVVARPALLGGNGDAAAEIEVPLFAHGSTLPRSVAVADLRPYAASMQLTVRTDRLVAGGDAMGRADDGRVVFVTGALPGELVEADIVEAKKDFVRSRARLVLEPSVHRQVPVCAHRRAGCGGCGWMHLEPAAQLEAKAEIVRESLRRIGRLDAAVVDDLVLVGGAVDPFGYRTTIRVVGGPDGTLGYREERSDRVVPITSCPIAASALSRLLAKIQLDDGAEVTLRTSVATGQITAIWAREHRHGVRGVPTGVHIGERAWLTERIAGVDLRVSAGSFFQSGAQGAELLVGAVGRAAPELVAARPMPSMPTAASACSPPR